MRRFVVLTVAVALCAGPTFAAQTREPQLEELVREVRELRRQVEELRARLEKIEAELAEEPEEPVYPTEDKRQRRGPNLKLLRQIELPDEPTREQVREYVKRIVRASANQNSASSADPQIRMLSQVGPDNVDILLDELAYGRKMVTDMYLTEAVENLARPQHKEEVLDRLALQPGLASIVVRYGWAADARGTLLSGLHVPGQYVPRAWLQAVANLRDAEALEALRTYFVKGRTRSTTYEILRMMPAIEDLEGLVAEAWKEARVEGGYEALNMAEIALGYGHEDALALLTRFLDGGEHLRGWGPSVRRALLQHTEGNGTYQQLVEWYQRNKDQIRWDADARKFRVVEDEGPPSADAATDEQRPAPDAPNG